MFDATISPDPGTQWVAEFDTIVILLLIQRPELYEDVMADDVYSFGTWVRLRRQALVLGREELAHQVGVAEVSIRKIEADERRPSPQVAPSRTAIAARP